MNPDFLIRTKIEGRISPPMYGQFLELMFEDIKGELHAELIRNRSFEEPANAAMGQRYELLGSSRE